MTKSRLHNFTIFLYFFSIIFIGGCSDDSDEETPPEVEADFNLSASSINIGESIQFTDISTGDPTSWSWTFEGGEPATSSDQNPNVTFTQAGSFNVALTASSGTNEDSASKEVTVNCTENNNQATFETYTKTEKVQYGINSGAHLMDIYQPASDIRCSRPAIVLFVGGGAGDPNSLSSIESMAISLAENGFVVGVGQYRSGNDSFFEMVLRNQQDIKAAVRYFRSQQNELRIDDSRIFHGGHGSGAIISLYAAYVTLDEIPSSLHPIVEAEGGLEGEQGNQDYSSAVAGIFTASGAIYDLVNPPTVIDQGEPPVFAVHGEDDIEIVIGCETTDGGAYQCGSQVIYETAQAANVQSELFVITGGSHSSPRLNPELYMDDLVSFLIGL
ncbi:MAG: PKD domain-containing protein [bacterium]|nr:PKD domain-containing protein [bacterium]